MDSQLPPSCGLAPVEPPRPDDCRELVERISKSAYFRRSPRLCELLRYLCRRVLKESATDIREQEIGVNVFGREPEYDTSVDPIVRVLMSQLRKKLREFYAAAGADEPIVLVIAKGGYLPTFRWRAEAKSPPAAPSSTGEPPLVKPGMRKRVLVWLFVGVAICFIWLAFRLIHTDSLKVLPGQPSLRLLWTRLFRTGQTTNLIVTDSCLSFLADVIGRPIGLDTYVNQGLDRWLRDAQLDAGTMKMLQMMTDRHYTTFANVDLARRITLLDPSFAERLTVTYPRHYNMGRANSDNLILLGGSRANPWVELYERFLNFRFDYDEASHKYSVRNRAPVAGEPAIYPISGTGAEIREGYAVVAFLPNLAHTRNVLILEGTNMEATAAAGQFILTEAQLRNLLARIKPGNRNELPYFEVLLKMRRLGGAPQEYQIEAFRQN